MGDTTILFGNSTSLNFKGESSLFVIIFSSNYNVEFISHCLLNIIKIKFLNSSENSLIQKINRLIHTHELIKFVLILKQFFSAMA
tara:strand:- start:500 stop:754 length:255 start_codon:yes stop_codon:yes gene_type:complete